MLPQKIRAKIERSIVASALPVCLSVWLAVFVRMQSLPYINKEYKPIDNKAILDVFNNMGSIKYKLYRLGRSLVIKNKCKTDWEEAN